MKIDGNTDVLLVGLVWVLLFAYWKRGVGTCCSFVRLLADVFKCAFIQVVVL